MLAEAGAKRQLDIYILLPEPVNSLSLVLYSAHIFNLSRVASQSEINLGYLTNDRLVKTNCSGNHYARRSPAEIDVRDWPSRSNTLYDSLRQKT